MKIIAAADGSALGNPGPAGWGWYIDEDRWASGGWPRGTNNMGELMAVLDLLRQTRGVAELEILCDSQYVINSVTKWMPGWKRKGWRKADGKPVLNQELLQEIDKEIAGRSVTFTWVKGHNGHPLNEAADKKANGAAQRFAKGSGGNAGPGFPSSTATRTTPAGAERSPAAAQPVQAPVQNSVQNPSAEPSAPAASDPQEALLSWDDGGAVWQSHDEPTDHEQVLALEKALLSPQIRSDAAEVAFLLHPEFQEIGASGRTYGREDILALIAGEEGHEVPEVDVLTTRDLTPGLIQIVYRAVERDRAVLRTSLWQRTAGRWQMIWHQGTVES